MCKLHECEWCTMVCLFVHSILILIFGPLFAHRLLRFFFTLSHIFRSEFTTRHLQYAQNILFYATWHNKMHGSCPTSNVLFADLLCALPCLAVPCQFAWNDFGGSGGVLLVRWSYLPLYTIWHQTKRTETIQNDISQKAECVFRSFILLIFVYFIRFN